MVHIIKEIVWRSLFDPGRSTIVKVIGYAGTVYEYSVRSLSRGTTCTSYNIIYKHAASWRAGRFTVAGTDKLEERSELIDIREITSNFEQHHVRLDLYFTITVANYWPVWLRTCVLDT